MASNLESDSKFDPSNLESDSKFVDGERANLRGKCHLATGAVDSMLRILDSMLRIGF